MKVLCVTFRYGQDVYGGAESYFRELAEEMRRFGAEVDVCTTKTHNLRPLIKSGEIWDNNLRDEKINDIDVHRFPVKNPNKYIALIFEKIIQFELEKEEKLATNRLLDIGEKYLEDKNGVLLTGWNQLERYDNFSMRWTRKNPILLIKDEDIEEVAITFQNKKRINGEIVFSSSTYEKRFPLPKDTNWKLFRFDVPNISGELYVSINLSRCWRPLKDFRSLGIGVSEITYKTKKYEKLIDLEIDYKKLLIKNGLFIEHFEASANKRSKIYGVLFDYLRGPKSPKMLRWLESNVSNYDMIIAQMLPFNTLKYSLVAKKHNIPLILLPLMHIDDEFYHWKHYYEILKKADMVLAISNYSKKEFFDRIGVKSKFVGSGINKDYFFTENVDGIAFKTKYNLEGKDIILTVSRKNQSKRYDLLIDAIKEINRDFKNAHLVMIGPDDDKVPINSENVSYLGKVSQEDLLNAYDACTVFAMMSESESFGMVFCEAWARKKPVIGNIYCGAVSNLIDNGIDGFLCSNVEEIIKNVEIILKDEKLALKFGERGLKKVIENYTWDIVTKKVVNVYSEILSKNNVTIQLPTNQHQEP